MKKYVLFGVVCVRSRAAKNLTPLACSKISRSPCTLCGMHEDHRASPKSTPTTLSSTSFFAPAPPVFCVSSVSSFFQSSLRKHSIPGRAEVVLPNLFLVSVARVPFTSNTMRTRGSADLADSHAFSKRTGSSAGAGGVRLLLFTGAICTKPSFGSALVDCG